MKIQESVLIVVDAQCGFSTVCPSQLPVPTALKIIPVVNDLLDLDWQYKFATLDWHPENHSSFKENGGAFPKHCVQGTIGADFLPGIHSEKFHAIFRKAYGVADSFSFLKEHPYVGPMLVCKDVYLCGICTNICVFETAKDIIKNQYVTSVNIIEDASATLGMHHEDKYHMDKVRNVCEHLGINFVNTLAI